MVERLQRKSELLMQLNVRDLIDFVCFTEFMKMALRRYSSMKMMYLSLKQSTECRKQLRITKNLHSN